MLLENNPYPQDVRVRSEAESLARAGHSVIAIAPTDGSQPPRERINGVDVVRFRLADGSAGGRVGFLREYVVAAVALHVGAIRELWRGSSVLHIHNPPDILFPAGALYRLAGRRVVFDHHDLFPETIDVKFGPGVASRFAAACQRLTIAVANHVIATNASYAEVAQSSGKRADEVTVVRNGPPAAWTELPSITREGVLGEVRIAYLGAMSSQDGVDGLAPILAHLRAGEDPVDVHLLVIGDGDARAALEADLAARGLAERVTFTGRVAPDQVPRLLGDADICIDPAPATDVNERSTMTKVAEYMALGKPVVSYDLLETRRTAGDAALFVRPGDADGFADAIRLLARDPELRGRLAGAARERAGSLTWQHSERALLRAYETLR
jgi:glycosyltransferase involved in cell wall biosynthesis